MEKMGGGIRKLFLTNFARQTQVFNLHVVKKTKADFLLMKNIYRGFLN
jgi:hypothetical protein